MKIRNDFVTNSSSSSFIIAKKYLDSDQIEAIREHMELAEKMDLDCRIDYSDEWSIEESRNYITGYTRMDNFSMDKFLESIEVPDEVITWGESEFDIDGSEYQDPKRVHKSKQGWRSLLHDEY